MRSREINRNSHMWHFQFSIWLKCPFGEVHFAENPTCSKVMSNWRILRTVENNRNSFLFLAIYLTINAANFWLIPLDRNTYNGHHFTLKKINNKNVINVVSPLLKKCSDFQWDHIATLCDGSILRMCSITRSICGCIWFASCSPMKLLEVWCSFRIKIGFLFKCLFNENEHVSWKCLVVTCSYMWTFTITSISGTLAYYVEFKTTDVQSSDCNLTKTPKNSILCGQVY